jgi:hypothetical protein
MKNYMTIIKRFNQHGDAFSATIEKHKVHGKYCGQIHHFDKPGSWFGWCEDPATVEAWIKEQRS